MRKSMHKTAIVALTMAAMTMSMVTEAQARIGSSSSSSSKSSASSSRLGGGSSSGMSRSTGSRVGSGSSMGMSRSGVMNSVRSQPRQAPAPSYRQAQQAAPAPSFRQPAPAAPAPSYQGNRYATSPSQAAPAKRNSWVAPAAAGVAAGALAGYALANTGNDTQPQQAPAPAPQYQQPAQQYQQPAQQYQQPAQQYQQAAPAPAPVYQQPAPVAPAYAAAPQQSSGGFGLGSLLLLALLIGGGYFAYRRYVKSKGDFKADARRTGNAAKAAGDAFKSSFNSSAAPAATDLAKGSSGELERESDDLSAIAQKFYKELQVLNNQGDLVELRNRVGDNDLYNGLADAIRSRTAPSQTEVISLQSTVVGMVKEYGQYIGSVRYQGLVQEGPNEGAESVDEVFHFVKDVGVQGSWKLAGIEQVEMA